MAPVGTVGQTVEDITIDVAGAKEGDLVKFTDLSTGSGNRFSQPIRTVGADGTWTGKLVYFDTPETGSDTDYVGNLRIGDVWFRWVVEQRLVKSTGPSIGSVTVTDTKNNSNRFTDKKFDVAVTMTAEGEPISTKAIDAYVEEALQKS